MNTLQAYDIYEITPQTTPIIGVKFRGRVRKYCLENSINILIENASDTNNSVRFAVFSGSDISSIASYIHTIAPDATIQCVMKTIVNPVLSKLLVNDLNRYEI